VSHDEEGDIVLAFRNEDVVCERALRYLPQFETCFLEDLALGALFHRLCASTLEFSAA